MPKYQHHHIHLMSHDAMAAGRFYETMFGAKILKSKGANGLPRCNMELDGHHTDLHRHGRHHSHV